VALTGERRHGKTAFSMGVEREALARSWTVITQSLGGTRTADEVSTVLARVLVAALLGGSRRRMTQIERRSQGRPTVDLAHDAHGDDLLDEACGHASRVVLILDELPICAREIERSSTGAGLAVLHTLRRSSMWACTDAESRDDVAQLRRQCRGRRRIAINLALHHVQRDGESGRLVHVLDGRAPGN